MFYVANANYPKVRLGIRHAVRYVLSPFDSDWCSYQKADDAEADREKFQPLTEMPLVVISE